MVPESYALNSDARRGTTIERAADQFAALIVPALAVVLLIVLASTLTDFIYTHAWASAQFATIARSFAQHGILHLGGVPIQNNDPLTSQPDTYTHFPPFYYYVLSTVVSIFPGSVRAMHLFMATIAIATAFTMWRIASRFVDRRAAAFGASAFLLMPSTLRYGLALLTVNLALLELAVALLLILRYLQADDVGRRSPRDLVLSAIVFFFACFTSWESFLALPGVVLVYWFDRRAAVLKIFCGWTLAAIAAVGSIVTIYALAEPSFLRDLWSIAALRSGLGLYVLMPTRIHPVEGWRATSDLVDVWSWHKLVLSYLVRTGKFLEPLGVVGIVMLLFAAIRQPLSRGKKKLRSVVLLPMTTVWLGWAIVMPQHYSMHEYQMVLATPLVAIALAVAYSLLEESRLAIQRASLRENLTALIRVALPCAMLLCGIAAATATYQGEEWVQRLMSFGRLIKREVPPGVIVMTDEASMVPVYYSERHIVRGMRDAADLMHDVDAIRGLCLSCQLYLAIARDHEAKFHQVVDHATPIFEDDQFIIKQLSGK